MARRKRNEGTVYKRKDGRYMIRVRSADGKPQWLYTRDEKQIEPLKTNALYNAARGVRPADKRQTFEQFATSWLEDAKAYKRASTWKNYEILIRVHLLPAFGKKKLAELVDFQVIENIQNKLVGQVGKRTVQRIRSLLHQMLGEAVRQKLMPSNPVKEVRRLPKSDQREMMYFEEEEAVRFQAATSTDRLAALYVLELTTGLRQGEILGLRWRDIDWKRKRLHVRQQATFTPDVQTGVWAHRLVAVLKSDQAHRTIDLSQTALTALRAHEARQNEERMWQGRAWHDQDLVFPDELGNITHARTLYYQFKQHLRRARLSDDPRRRAELVEKFRFHDLRHTAATLMLERGVDLNTVSKVLGHKKPEFTQRVYGHVTPRMHQRAADEMDAIFGGGSMLKCSQIV